MRTGIACCACLPSKVALPADLRVTPDLRLTPVCPRRQPPRSRKDTGKTARMLMLKAQQAGEQNLFDCSLEEVGWSTF